MPYWETGLIKWSTLLIGIAIGAYWSHIFKPYALLLAIVGVIVAVIAGSIWVKE